MGWRIFLYGLWCLGIVGAYLSAAVVGYSPFADGGRPLLRTAVFGPTHK